MLRCGCPSIAEATADWVLDNDDNDMYGDQGIMDPGLANTVHMQNAKGHISWASFPGDKPSPAPWELDSNDFDSDQGPCFIYIIAGFV